ncbi:MAG: hypothetical protein HDR49_06835 [Bacteroides sp.]|nr:hypothetical protein [Bacteroides sp.]
MVEKSLVSIKDVLTPGRLLSKGLIVVLPTGYEAEIYGFIAIEDNVAEIIDIDKSGNTSIDMPPLGEAIVLSNRVIFSMNEKVLKYPIFNIACKATENRYNLKYLYIPKFLRLSGNKSMAYRQSMKKDVPDSNVGKIENVEIDDNRAYYYTSDSDILFKSDSMLRGISNDFAVITRRLSSKTDDIKYEIFSSNEILIEKNEASLYTGITI